MSRTLWIITDRVAELGAFVDESLVQTSYRICLDGKGISIEFDEDDWIVFLMRWSGSFDELSYGWIDPHISFRTITNTTTREAYRWMVLGWGAPRYQMVAE